MKDKLPPIAGSVYRIYDKEEHKWVRLYAGRWEFLFIRQGRLQLSYNDTTLELAADKNNFLVYKPGFSYHFKAFPDSVFIYVHFDLREDMALRVNFTEILDGLGCFTLENTLLRRVKRDLLEIIELEKEQTENWESLAMLLAETVLMRVCTSESGSSIAAPKLLNAYSLLNEMADVPMKSVAKACGVSVPVLYRLFRNETGMTPRSYHENIKLREAARLLRETSMTLSEIASHVNLYDQYYLSKRFKKIYGISPAFYRKKYKEN